MKTIIILFSFVILSFSEGYQLLSQAHAQAALRSGLTDFTEFEIYPGGFWQKQSVIYHQNNFSERAYKE